MKRKNILIGIIIVFILGTSIGSSPTAFGCNPGEEEFQGECLTAADISGGASEAISTVWSNFRRIVNFLGGKSANPDIGRYYDSRALTFSLGSFSSNIRAITMQYEAFRGNTAYFDNICQQTLGGNGNNIYNTGRLAWYNGSTSENPHPQNRPFALTPSGSGMTINCNFYDRGDPYTRINGGSTPQGGGWRTEQVVLRVWAIDNGGNSGELPGEGRKFRWANIYGDSGERNAYCNSGVGLGAGAGTGFGTLIGGTNGIYSSTIYSGIYEGDFFIHFCNRDLAGNANDLQRYGNWRVDLNPPNTPVVSSPSHPENTWVSNSNISVSVDLQGIKTQLNQSGSNTGPSPVRTEYCVSTSSTNCTGSWAGNSLHGSGTSIRRNSLYTTPALPDGEYFLLARANENEKPNERLSGTDSYRIRIDTTPPVFTVNGNPIPNGPGPHSPIPTGVNWTNDPSDVIINLGGISDADSGIQFSKTRWERNPNMSACVSGTNYGGTNITTTIPSQGIYSHAICIRDNTGNDTEVFSGEYRYDNTVPATPSISSSHTRDAWNTTGTVSFNVTNNDVFDYGSNPGGSVGPSPYETRYCIKKGSPCTAAEVNNGTIGTSYNGNLEDGTWYFSARTIETEFGTAHMSPIETYMIRIDTEAPIHNANPANRLDWSNVSTLNINLTSSDPIKDSSNSGIAQSRYIVNQNATSPFNATCTNGGTNIPDVYTDFAEGTNYIHVCTIDVAGNRNVNTAPVLNTYGYYLVDLTDPVITDDYDNATEDGVWVNSSRTITFTSNDAHSGTRYIRYCLGAGCTPNILMGAEVTAVGTNTVTRSLTFNPETDTILRYQSEDYATRTSIISEIDIKIEDNIPTSPIGGPTYYDGRDNNTIANRRDISYSGVDTGGSQLETVTLQRRVATTNNAGGYGGWGAWQDAETNTGLNTDTFSRTFSQGFENGRAMQFRVLTVDEAGNTGIIRESTNTLRMDNIIPQVTDDYGNSSVWVNTTQTIDFSPIDDNDSGIVNIMRSTAENDSGRRYCTTTVGGTCNPDTYLSNTLSFSPDTENTIIFETRDRAGNDSIQGSIDVLIENNRPDGTISYLNGWDNDGGDGSTPAQSTTNRTISYSARDTLLGPINSNLRTVILQRGQCPVTGACNPTSWDDVVTHNIDQPTLLNQAYVQPFTDDTSYRYRLYIEDHAGNVVAPSGYVNSTSILRMDRIDPSLTLAYSATTGVWYNTDQTITFSESDNYAGIQTEFYCTTAYGSSCDPLTSGIIPPASRVFTAPTELSVFYQAVDNAGNASNIEQIDVLIEDNNPLPSVVYTDEWINTPVSIGYRGLDSSAGPLSNIRTLSLQRREADITANNGTIGGFGGWLPVPGEVHNLSSGTPERSTVTNFAQRNYTQGFENRKAYQYRTYIEDVAGNRTWMYIDTNGNPVAVLNTDTPPAGAIATLKMENEESTITFSNLDTNISPNGWTNVTAQNIRISFADTGGSLLDTYTLQVFDATDNPDYNSLNSVKTAGTTTGTWNGSGSNNTWVNVTGHVNRNIGGVNLNINYNFTGVNDHAYTFRLLITDNAGNTTPWLYSIDDVTPIKIDTVDPLASDISDSSLVSSPALASAAENFVYDVGRNGGAPIVNVIGNFEDWNTANGRLGDHSSIDPIDNNSADASQINVNHSIQNVDLARTVPAGYREYSYSIIRIEDEAGNVTTVPSGIRNFDYQVYANTNVPEIAIRELDNVADVTDTSNIADGNTDTLTARLEDTYGNSIVRATGIGREIDFRLELSADSSILLNQYERTPGEAVFIETSSSSGYQDLNAFLLNPSYLENLDFETGRNGQYDFNFRVYGPTANWYPGVESVSDPGARFFIQNFQFAVEHSGAYSAWDTGDQSLDNGQDIDFVYGPLFTTDINGAIDSFGFIEGANQSSNIEIEKANSTATTNSRELWNEFGIDDRLPSPELGLEINGTAVPEGSPNASVLTSFNLIGPNSTQSYTIDSLLSMSPGTTLDEIQSSYLSTHISYNIDTYNVKYNADIIGKDNYFSNTPVNNTTQGGIKVLGQTHSANQKDIVTNQGADDLALLGKLYKASLKKDVIKNAFTIIRNADATTSIGANPGVGDLTDFSDSSNDGTSLFNDSIMYFGVDTNDPNSEVEITGSEINGEKTILAYGRNIYINNDLYYDDKENDTLGIIALTDEAGNGGNIYIDPNVTNVVGTLFAEKSLMSYDGTNELGGGTSQSILRHQLHIYGSIFSENTIGGSREVTPVCPYYIDESACTRDAAQIYDMNYLRRYFTYTEGAYRLPANNAKVIGGGTCDSTGDCTSPNSGFNRIITSSDTDTYATYPVVVEYNPSAQNNPAPLFESTSR